jgi:hypothetical protein
LPGSCVPSEGCGKCVFKWVGKGCLGSCYYNKNPNTGNWELTSGQCVATGTDTCSCPTVSDLAASFAKLPPTQIYFSTGCIVTGNVQNGSYQPVGFGTNTCTPTNGCSCPAAPTGDPTVDGWYIERDCTVCQGCDIAWNGKSYYVLPYPNSNRCTSPECGGCYLPANFQGNSLTVPCANNPPADRCSTTDPWPKQCQWTCNGDGTWSQTKPCAAGCGCNPPGTVACFPANAGDTYSNPCLPGITTSFVPDGLDDWNSFYIDDAVNSNPNAQNLLQESKFLWSASPTPYVEHTPVPTPPPSITPSTSDVLTTQETLISKLSAIKKDKVKLCQFAGKEPLKMIKQGCGSCAIRKCDKFGLCSHTGIIEGHPEVICCQECSQYVPAGITSVKTMSSANAPVAQSINAESQKPNSQTLTSISEKTPTTQSLSVAKDPITMADDLIQENNKLKIVPTDSIIRVDLDDLLEGKSKNE